MIRYTESITVEAEPPEIFKWLADIEEYPQWMNIGDPEVVTPDVPGQGARWRAASDESAFLVENNRYEQDRLVGFRTIEGPMDWTGEFRTAPIP